MTQPQLVLGIPPAVLELVQTGLLERAFHDGLVPALMYRGEAQDEEWPAQTGQEIFMSRPGMLAPITKPIAPGQDPTPQAVAYEQWSARLHRYAGTIDTHVPTSVLANADQFNRNIHQLGIQAGMSLNRIPRNALFQAYLSGQTNMIQAGLSGDTTIRVASLNGFTDVIIKGQNVRPAPVSPATPLRISITGVTGTRNVIGYTADDPDDPLGPGTLQLDAALGTGISNRAPVVSAFAPTVIRSGGGASVDAIGPGDTFVLQDLIVAVNRLRKANVQPHEDGFYHAHFSTDTNTQIFTDPAFRQATTALIDHVYYKEAVIGMVAGCLCFMNNESPDWTNSGNRVATGALSYYSEDIGAETINKDGVPIGRVIVTGRGALYEKWLDESKYVTEAGITGRVGQFQVVNAGIEVQTKGVRLILRAPLNRLQDIVAASWSISTSFPVPSDVTSGGSQRFKRAMVIEHALDS